MAALPELAFFADIEALHRAVVAHDAGVDGAAATLRSEALKDVIAGFSFHDLSPGFRWVSGRPFRARFLLLSTRGCASFLGFTPG
jgi:hypothetical protein